MHIFTPYRVCPLGAHVDHQLGWVTGFAINKGVDLEYEPTEDGHIQVISSNFSGISDFKLNQIPERQYTWGDFIQGAVVALSRKYQLSRGFHGKVTGGLPVGGLSSSAAVILTYLNVLCKVNGISMTRQELINMAIWEEREYIGVKVGKLDQSCEVYCKKDALLYLDTYDDSSEIIPLNPVMKPFEIMIVFSGVERKLAGSAYNTRVDECKSASYAMKAFSSMEYGKYQDTYLRDVPYGIFEEFQDKLPEKWRMRAEHFYGEEQRVKRGVAAWRSGDIEVFGQCMFESGHSSIELYETGSEELKAIQDILENTEGVYGGRFSGAGFNGSSVALIDPEKKEKIAACVEEKYLSRFPKLKGKFSIHFCKTADGVKL
ncbi:MAG: galactokinase family protein [Lachnospira sp.]|nr:galactokinase family protein [Lachnospira sp.]